MNRAKDFIHLDHDELEFDPQLKVHANTNVSVSSPEAEDR
jgi:hypothetical protein